MVGMLVVSLPSKFSDGAISGASGLRSLGRRGARGVSKNSRMRWVSAAIRAIGAPAAVPSPSTTRL